MLHWGTSIKVMGHPAFIPLSSLQIENAQLQDESLKWKTRYEKLLKHYLGQIREGCKALSSVEAEISNCR